MAVAEGDDCGNPSDKPDWTKEGDNSVFCNRYPEFLIHLISINLNISY
jgi:hypothetical protein